MRWSRELAQREGIFVGITGGATFSGALQVCELQRKLEQLGVTYDRAVRTDPSSFLPSWLQKR